MMSNKIYPKQLFRVSLSRVLWEFHYYFFLNIPNNKFYLINFQTH